MNKIKNTKTIKEKIFNSPGYSTDMCLSPDELNFFRCTIEEQWLGAIALRYPEYEESFRKLGLANYHKYAPSISDDKLN